MLSLWTATWQCMCGIVYNQFMISNKNSEALTRDLDRWNHAIYNQTWTHVQYFFQQSNVSKAGLMRKLWWMSQENVYSKDGVYFVAIHAKVFEA